MSIIGPIGFTDSNARPAISKGVRELMQFIAATRSFRMERPDIRRNLVVHKRH
jgi:hypothetical protein